MTPCGRSPIDAHQHAKANRQNHRDHKTPRSVSIFSSIVLHRGRRLLDLMSFFHSYGSQSPDRPPIIDRTNPRLPHYRSGLQNPCPIIIRLQLRCIIALNDSSVVIPGDSQTFVVLRTQWIYKGPYQTPIISPYDLPHHQDFAYYSNLLKDFTPVEWNLHCQGSKPCGLSHCN